ncbi:MAG: polyprenol monophosphomannose synthase [Terriglobales bacterium]
MSPLSQFARPIACVVLPTYNERNNLRVVLPRIFEQAARIETHDLHVLVVDDNSPDGTAEVVREAMPANPKLHLITGEKRGLGEAYQRGMAHAVDRLGASLLLEMDADGQHDPALLPKFIRLCAKGDRRMVIGSRFLPGASMPDFGPARRAMSSVGSFLVRLCGGVGPVSDCTSGYRCFPVELFSGCDFSKLPTRGYSFQTAILFELVRQGAEVVEIPLVFAPRLDGESKLKMRDCVEFVATLGGLLVRRFSTPAVVSAPSPVAAEPEPAEIIGKAV